MDVILSEIEFDSFTLDRAKEKVKKIAIQPNHNEALMPNYIIVGNGMMRSQIPEHTLVDALQNPNIQLHIFCQYYLASKTLMLDGRNRINLVTQQQVGDLQQPAYNSFMVLFKDEDKRKKVRRIIYDAFELYFVVDPTHLGQLRLRLSSRPPSTNLEECGIHDEAIQFHSNATLVEQASDGVKAFTGIVTEIIAIVRLTYRGGIPTARILSNKDILRLMRNPLLRSTGVISGLFYEFVIVTESDADRAFYQEINERLLRYKPELGISNCLFIHAQNKQTVKTIIKPLRELGIPAVGVVDIDILKEGGKVWSDFLESSFVPNLEHESLANLRHAIKKKFDKSGKDMKLDGGIELLDDGDKEAANNLFDKLAQYGLFAVRGGELESWLLHLHATGHGPNWLIAVFEKMGEDPESIDYLKPSDDDVWSFIGEIKKWFTNPNRKGIPL